MKVFSKRLVAACLCSVVGAAHAADYVIDGSGGGMHSSVTFRASHIGISALWGRFNDVSGTFSYDAKNPGAAKISVKIVPASIDTNLKVASKLHAAEYGDKTKVELTGKNGGPVQLLAMTDEELLKIAAQGAKESAQ